MRIASTLGAVRKASLALFMCGGLLLCGAAPAAAGQSQVPEEVAGYVGAELIPRLTDLYGPDADGTSGIDFALSTTGVGDIVRVMEWTDDFRAGVRTDLAVEATNTWVVPLWHSLTPDGAVADSRPLGVATVWISPYSSEPELAGFIPSGTLGPALMVAPEGSMLVHDKQEGSWFALKGNTLTSLAQGEDAVTGISMSLSDAQSTLGKQLETLPQEPANNAILIVGLGLAFVLVLLAIFVLVPGRRRSALDPGVAPGAFSSSPDRD